MAVKAESVSMWIEGREEIDTDVLAWKDFMVRTKPHIRICSGKNELT
jgi:hypothetical protein